MTGAWEEHRAGLRYLEAATALLQRARHDHPTWGLYEAADLQWWWRTPRPTDDAAQLFWFDDAGDPVAAVIATHWTDHVALAPLLLPDATPAWSQHVVERGLAHAAELGLDAIRIEVDRADAPTRDLLRDLGFTVDEDAIVETWLDASRRPPISPLAEHYRLASRIDVSSRAHHMIGRSGPDVEARLSQTSLYRPDLDLVVFDRQDRAAAYGLFWFDPVTATGLVEPMRTEDDHQRRGLARHVLTSGIDRLAAAGAERIKICFEPHNAASSSLYLDVGFQPDRRTDVFVAPLRSSGRPPSSTRP